MHKRILTKIVAFVIWFATVAAVNIFSVPLPGDIAQNAGTPLVATHSMTRALYSSYNGRLFQVRRTSDGATKDISVARAGGYVDMDDLNSFLSGVTGRVTVLYDQSGNANHLRQELELHQMDLAYWSLSNSMIVPMAVTYDHQWLRNRKQTSKIPIDAEDCTQYFVVHGQYYRFSPVPNNPCCWNYGNTEYELSHPGPGYMNSLYFGGAGPDVWWDMGSGTGPWVGVDYEAGVFGGGLLGRGANKNDSTVMKNVVTGLSKTNGTTKWVLKSGDATTGPLEVIWDGALPPGYNPLHQEGGLSLGEGGDGAECCSGNGAGAFFEGVIIAALTTDETDSLMQANITSVYGTDIPTPFTPESDLSLKAWWDGNDVSQMTFSGGPLANTGTPVASWTDKSSNGYGAAQSTTAQQPTYFPELLNGKGGLQFESARNTILTTQEGGNLFTDGAAVYYVIQPLTVPEGYQSVIAQSTSTAGEPGFGSENFGLAIGDFGSSATGSSTLRKRELVPYLGEYISEGAPNAGGSFSATPYMNGESGSPLTQNIGAYAASGVHIGNVKSRHPLDGFIYEIVVSADTTSATRQKYEGYFAAKYGLLGFLPEDHPYREGDTTTTTVIPAERKRQNLSASDIFLYERNTDRSVVLTIRTSGMFRLEVFGLDGRRRFSQQVNAPRRITVDWRPVSTGVSLARLTDLTTRETFEQVLLFKNR